MSTFFYKEKGLIIFFIYLHNFMRENINFLTLLSYKKFISCLLPVFILLSNPIFAEQLLTKSEILRKSNDCFKDLQYKLCTSLILEIEKIQSLESEHNRYKCQGSILGLQTELIEAFYFKKLKKDINGMMLSSVIKNC